MSSVQVRAYSLRALYVLLLGFTVLYPRPAYAANTATCSVDSRFGARETAILKRACALAVERLQSKAVRRAVYERAEYATLSGSVMNRSNVTDTARDRWNLLNQQLIVLSLPNGKNDTEPPFPDIHIEYAHQAERSDGSGWLGRAPLDTVTVYWDGREWKQRGSFRIDINDYYVARGTRYSDPNNWAGTIAHEMLHNLGHSHPASVDSNWHKYQINVLDELVQNDGYGYKVTGGAGASPQSCGGTEASVSTRSSGDGEGTTITVTGRVNVTVNGNAKVRVNGRAVN